MWSNRDRRTLLDKMLALLGIVAITEPCYFARDAAPDQQADGDEDEGGGDRRGPTPTAP